MKPKTAVVIDSSVSNKKVYFGESGDVIDKPVVKHKIEDRQKPESTKTKREFKKQDVETKWYQLNEEHNTKEFADIKDSELQLLEKQCRSSFNDEILKLTKSKLNQSIYYY